MSISKLSSGPQMWWHADLPAAASDPGPSQTPPELAREDWAAPSPDGADMLEWILPYDVVRAASDPDATLLAFLQSTHAAAADLAKWDRAALEVDKLP